MKLSVKGREEPLVHVQCEGEVSQLLMRAGAGDPLENLLGRPGFAGGVLFDLSRTTFIDTSGVGWMLSSNKRFREAGGRLVFHSAPPLVKQTLDLLQMNKVLHLAADEAIARKMAQVEKVTWTLGSAADGVVRLAPDGHLTTLSLQTAGADLEQVAGPDLASRKALFDLSRVGFVDSGGIVWLLQTHLKFERAGGRVVFCRLTRQVEQTLRTVQADGTLRLAADEAAGLRALEGGR